MDKNMTIFLIDDDEDDRKLFFEAVKEFDEDITCLGASNGQEGLNYLQDEGNPPPDFIFLDLRMPGLSGEKCLEKIKSDPRLAPVTVIVYTTSREVDESIKLKKMGANHYMSKPVSPDDIYYMVSVVLSEKWK
jgi:CheY-like chemotaxis protein